MTLSRRALALAFGTILASSGPTFAADPAGSAPTARVPDAPPPQSLPLPDRTQHPTGQIVRPLVPADLPQDLSAGDDADLDQLIGVLGAVNFGAPAGTCDGLIPCCVEGQDPDCEFVSFDIACVDAGGFIQITELPDGSIQYSCPNPQ